MMYEYSPHQPTDSVDLTKLSHRRAPSSRGLASSAQRRQLALRETAPAYECQLARSGLHDAGAVHELLRALNGLGNEVRLRFVEALRTLRDGNMCCELGYSSFNQYCDRELGLARSTALEYVRVAYALDDLPQLRSLFGQGELSWEQVRAITRVATAGTEVAWIEFAFDEPVKRLMAEVREAGRTGRDAPRDKRHGLPNIMVRLSLDVTLEEKERVRAAFALVSSDGGPDLKGGPGDHVGRDGSEGSDPRPPLVRWADGVLSGAIPAGPTSRAPGMGAGPKAKAKRPAPGQMILYRTCPECRETVLDTDEGPLSVNPERVVELAPVANSIEIAAEEELQCEVLPAGQVDEPNSARLARQVLSRDGLRCANPGCDRRRNLHAHHIVFRAQGGPTVLSNEVAVCDTCHAMLHKGLLEVTGSPDTGLTWKPRPLASDVQVRDADALRERLGELGAELASGPAPDVWPPAAPSVGPDSPPETGAPPSMAIDTRGAASDGGPGAVGSPGPPSRHVATSASTQEGTIGSIGAPMPPPSMAIDTNAGARDMAPGTAGGPLPRPSTAIDTPERLRDLAEGLARLGCSRREGERRVRSAIATLVAARAAEARNTGEFVPPDDAEILTQALRG